MAWPSVLVSKTHFLLFTRRRDQIKGYLSINMSGLNFKCYFDHQHDFLIKRLKNSFLTDKYINKFIYLIFN